MSMNIALGELGLTQTPTDVSYKILYSSDPFRTYMDYYCEHISGDGCFQDIEDHALMIMVYMKGNPGIRWSVA